MGTKITLYRTGDNNAFRFIHNEAKEWANNMAGYNTPYRRLKNTLYITTLDAMKAKTNSSSFSVSFNGQHYDFHNSFEKPLKVNMYDWMQLSSRLCHTILPGLISRIVLLSGADNTLRTFNLNKISDDFTQNTIYKQSKNVEYLGSLQNKII